MDIFRLVSVGLIGAIACLLLKKTDGQYAAVVAVATGVVILIICIKSLSSVLVSLQSIVDRTGIDDKLFSTLLKIVGIGYLTEYACGLCDDIEAGGISKKIALGGKIAIFLSALPIVNALIDAVAELV